MSADLDDLHTTRSIGPRGDAKAGRERRLLVFEGTRSSVFDLPRNGVILLGSGPEADLRFSDDAVSRKHARLVLSDGQARVADLDSRNGTWVNGARITASQPIELGDVITVGEVTLLVRGPRDASGAPRPPLSGPELRQRMEEELERAARYGRPLSVVVIATGKPPSDAEKVYEVVFEALRPHGIAGWANGAQLVALVPELDGDAVEGLLGALPAALAPWAKDVKTGVATFADDGCDADTLIIAARLAASSAAPGSLTKAEDIPTVRHIGERSIVVADPAVSRIFLLIERLAASDLPVLVTGETGVGKENAAYAVHAWSARARKPFVVLNCAALQEMLIESELFGYEKGAFTGAVAAKPGLLETASGGTVFLDEVGDLSAAAQAKLLRVLELGRLTRLGDVRERDIDIRMVCATHRDLEAEVSAGRFRRDLYFRLSAGTVILPPLRERPREVPLLSRRFLAAACAKLHRAEMTIAAPAMRALAAYPWPGNVRELRNVMEYVAAVVVEDRVEPWHLPDKVLGEEKSEGGAPVDELLPAAVARPSEAPRPPPADAARAAVRPVADELRELEKRRMREALEMSGGVQRRAAELIGMPLRTFTMKFKQYGFRGSED